MGEVNWPPMDDVVFFLDEAAADREEIRFALRGLEQVPHGRVFILGHRPSWMVNVAVLDVGGRLPDNKWEAIDMKWRLLGGISEHVSDQIIYMEDDYFILRNHDELPNYHWRTAAERVTYKGLQTDWITTIHDTDKWLTSQGYVNSLNFDVHIPMVVRPALIDPNVEAPHPLRWRTVLGALDGRRGIPIVNDVKIQTLGDLYVILNEGLGFLSTHDETWLESGARGLLNTLYPKPCRYETLVP